jgi:glycosyl transferase, family 25
MPSAELSLPPCWVITLNPESDRVRRLFASLAAQGVQAEVFTGVDGRQGEPELQPGETLDRAKTRRRHLCELTNTEIGCYLSHLRAIKRAYASGVERLCLLEDDVAIEPSFARCLRELNQLPEAMEFIRLMALKVRRRKIVQPLADGEHSLTRPERGLLGTQGYLINRAGMAKVIAYGNTIFEPIDKLFDHFWEFDLNHYGVEPHLLWELEQDSSIEKSNVHRARVGFWYRCFRPIGKGILSWRRHRYLRRHQKDFYPASRPQGLPGRTQRMKPK